MKIYVEGSPLIKERSGVGQYTKRLVEAMTKASPADEFTIFGFRFFTKPIPQSVLAAPVQQRFNRLLPGRVYNLLFKLGLAPPIDLVTTGRPDAVWFPNFVVWPVWRRKTKIIVTIYDISFINYPQFASPANLRYMLRFVPRAIRRADRIVTISESSRHEIAKHYNVSPSRIDIVYPAVDDSEYYPRSTTNIAAVRTRLGLPKKYILFTGTLEPRKNIEGLLSAYSALSEELRQQYSLVLVGGKGWKDESIVGAVNRLCQKGEDIISLGYIADNDLPAIYSGASLFVYPSFYEGFGMPPLEAMACGVPVITADNSSLPEVVGKAGIVVDANDTDHLSAEMARVLNDTKLAASLAEAGLARAKKFSWQASAEKMLKIIKDA